MSRDDGERFRAPSRLGDILPGALERVGGERLWLEAKVRTAWQQVANPQIREHAWIRRVRGNVLEVGVDSDVWGTELRYLGGVLCEKINAVLGEQVVVEVAVWKTRGTIR